MTTVLLHWLGADRRQPLELFLPAVRSALGPDEPVVAPEVRAHGDDPRIGAAADFAIDRLAEEVAVSVREQLGADAGSGAAVDVDAAAPVTILGISMGAAIALRIALRGLLPVERAVFVRPAFGDRSLPDNLRQFPVIGELLAAEGPGAVERFRETSLFRRVEAESPAGGVGLLSQFGARAARERAVRLVEIPRNRAFADDAELATLAARGVSSFVVGAPRDPVHPFALAERWAGGLAAPLAVVPARDDGQAAQTAAVRSAVAGWLAA